MTRLILLLFLISIAFSSQAQKSKTWLKKGEEAKSVGNWPLAHACYEKAYEMDSADFDNTIPYAESCRMMKMNERALYLYQKLYDKDKGRLFPESLYWMASMQRSGGDYDEAYRNFRKFIKKNKKSILIGDAEIQAEGCRWALDYKSTETIVEPLLQEENVNTVVSEFAPNIESSSGKLLFTRLNESGTFDLFSAVMRDSLYRDPEIIPFSDRDYKSIGSLCFSSDSSTVYFTCVRNNSPLRKLCSASWQQGHVGEIVYIGRINELDSAEFTTPHVSTFEGKELLWFASDMQGGMGGWDIYYSEISEGFTAPKNAGNVINTKSNELAPFAYLDTLYFSSEGYAGFGGYDLFKSQGNTSKGFERPVNLGKPYNSSSNDLYYHRSDKAGSVFFSSNRESGKSGGDDPYPSCCSDIYQIPLPKENESTDAEFTNIEHVRIELPVRLYFHNDEPNPNTRDTSTTITYTSSYNSYISLKSKYLSENTKGFSKEEAEERELLTEEFFDLHAKGGFEDLQDFRKLVLSELEDGKRLRVYVRGFASPRAQTDYNVNLTKRRITSLINDFRSAQAGVFKPYLEGNATNGGKLEFVEKPFGEYKADKGVSDDLFNEKESIYSTGACLERKIEIEAIEVIPDAFLVLNKNMVDLGKISADSVVQANVLLTNSGGSMLSIDSILVSCGCTTAQLDKLDIPPGEESRLELTFDSKGLTGFISRSVVIYFSNGEKREIEIVTEVE